jgi:APA family basic amino acid/polyamine antiporter
MVGTGIFATTGFMAGDLGSAGLILAAWCVGAFFAFAGALSYSELGVNFPKSGGEYVYLTEAYGPTWGFMTGWVSFFAGFSAPIAAAALAFSGYLASIFPALKPDRVFVTVGTPPYSFSLGGGQLAACALIGVFTLLNCLGLKRTTVVQNILTITKLAVITAFIICGFVFGKGDWSHFSQSVVRTSTLPLPTQFIVSLIWVMVGYSGWNAATYVAEEMKHPEQNLPAALAIGTGIVGALYLGLNLLFIYSTPLDRMKGVVAVGALSASNLFGAGIAGLFSALMAASIMATVNAMVTVGPRVYYAMARRHAFFAAAGAVSPRWHTPAIAIVSQGVCAMLMTFTPFPDLMVYIGMSLTFFTVMSVASVLVFRRTRAPWKRLPAVSVCYPLIPLAYCVVGACMMVYGLIGQPRSSLAAFATVAAGALAYRYTVLKPGR